MDHGTHRQIRVSKRAWVAIISTVLIATAGYLLWVRIRSPTASVEYRVHRAFAKVRWEERRSQSSLTWLYWLESLKDRVFKRERRFDDPSQDLEALGKKAFPALSKALTGDRSAAVRKVAAEVLGNLGDTPSLSLLTNVLCADTDAEVRQAAARSLAAIGAPMILPVAIRAFQQETNDLVRGELVSLLGSLRDNRAVPLLLAELRSDRGLVSEAARALGQIGDPSALPELIAAATTNMASNVRRDCIGALAAFQGRETVFVLTNSLLTETDNSVRMEAAAVLARHSDVDSAAPALLRAFAQEKDPGVRSQIIGALQGCAGPSARSALAHAAEKDPDENVRSSAVRALANAGGNDAAQVLLLTVMVRT